MNHHREWKAGARLVTNYGAPCTLVRETWNEFAWVLFDAPDCEPVTVHVWQLRLAPEPEKKD